MEQYNVGDYLVSTGCRPTFFRVEKVTPKRLRLMEQDSIMVHPLDGCGFRGHEVPVPTLEGEEHIGRPWEEYILVGSRSCVQLLRKWDGEPVYADHLD